MTDRTPPDDRDSIPPEGRFNQRRWARLLGVSEETFRDDVKALKIPHRIRGRDIYVDAGDLWAALPSA